MTVVAPGVTKRRPWPPPRGGGPASQGPTPVGVPADTCVDRGASAADAGHPQAYPGDDLALDLVVAAAEREDHG
ncbi:hypothetical protein DXZ75_02515 [Streptomyces sp. AcE210]|nr:hypothetical protein DXZ75_02515 [Streptomyces sp. AcE210]